MTIFWKKYMQILTIYFSQDYKRSKMNKMAQKFCLGREDHGQHSIANEMAIVTSWALNLGIALEPPFKYSLATNKQTLLITRSST